MTVSLTFHTKLYTRDTHIISLDFMKQYNGFIEHYPEEEVGNAIRSHSALNKDLKDVLIVLSTFFVSTSATFVVIGQISFCGKYTS